MKTSVMLALLLTAGTLHARSYVPSPTNEDQRTQQGTTVKGGEIVVKATPDLRFSPGRLQGEPVAPLANIELRRDFRDSPPENLVRGTLEAANGENN